MGFLPDHSKVVTRRLLERNAVEFPNKKCALFENNERWTYNEALQEAYGAANALSEFGVRRGDNVLIFLPNSQWWIRAWWGVQTLGAVMVPVNTAYRGEMLRHICLDSQAKHIITTPDLAERLKVLSLDLTIIDPTGFPESPSDEPKLDEPIEPWDIAVIMYTSGTTGPSKGVITTYLHHYMHGIHTWKYAKQDDVILVDSPLFHATALMVSHALWSVGGRIALRTKFSGSRYLSVVRETGATMHTLIGTMPAFLDATPPKPDDADNPLRVVGMGPVVKNPDNFMKRFGIEILHTGFSMSETSQPFLSQGPIKDPKSCGKVRAGVEVRLVDEHDIPVPFGEVGELIVRADLPWEMNVGYWRRPAETAHAWRNGWFHTGDLFTCDEEGNYFFVDRQKDALRRRGENISSFEVEREVMAYPDVLEAACVGVQEKFGVLTEDEVKVFVIPREGSQFDPADLIKYLTPRMPYFMVPRYIEVMSEFPKTPSMRVKKYELRARGNSAATWDREAAGITVPKN